MTPSYLRTAVASGAVFTAVFLPVMFWRSAGRLSARREAQEIREAPRREAAAIARQSADRLLVRLETLREAESRRPFYHYQNLYHDPRGAYEGKLSIIPSPLAEGPADPLIRAHFQIDERKRLSIPTLNDEIPEASQTASPNGQETVCQELARSTQRFIEAAGGTAPRVQQAELPVAPAQTGQRIEQQTLDPEVYAQNRSSNEYFNFLKQGKGKGEKKEISYASPPPPPPSRVVTVEIESFSWKTVDSEGGRSLVALRRVYSPEGVIVQGFQIDPKAVSAFLGETTVPATFSPEPGGGAGIISVPVAATGWHVVADAGAAVSSAERRAEETIRAFDRLFLGGTGVAAFFGVCAALFLWQMEHLAISRSRFAAAAAHELRTPLAGLRMYSEMLAEGLGDPAKATSYARRLADESARLGRVVANILGFTRMERGNITVQPLRGDLAQAVREIAEGQRPALEALGAPMEVGIPTGPLMARFDRDALAQILQNLLDNAEKYGRGAADRSITVRLSPVEGKIALTVSDRGPGIPSDARRRLFAPFKRGADPDAPAGLGLGLAITRSLARAQGGDVTHADNPGGGSVFTLTLHA